MPFRQYSLTLTAAAQRLSSVLPDTTVGGRDDVGCGQILLAADPANAAVVYIGDDSSVSATNHAFSLDPTQASQGPVSLGPFDRAPIKLSDLWALGSNNERLMIGIIY